MTVLFVVYVVLYLHSTSNHNLSFMYLTPAELSYIFILHQTTTLTLIHFSLRSCLISSFYIKPQPTARHLLLQKVVLYLHSTSNHNSCMVVSASLLVVLYLHSTSNHNNLLFLYSARRVVLYLHSTSNHNTKEKRDAKNAVVLYLHSTSNHNFFGDKNNFRTVVLYLHSTSNHNRSLTVIPRKKVVLYLHSTSNHNTMANKQNGT